MEESINKGLNTRGVIPGRLKLKRKAGEIYDFRLDEETPEIRKNRLLSSFAYAVSEENASGGIIVTAPTCGASGVLPAVLYYMKQEKLDFCKEIEDLKIVEILIIIHQLLMLHFMKKVGTKSI